MQVSNKQTNYPETVSELLRPISAVSTQPVTNLPYTNDNLNRDRIRQLHKTLRQPQTEQETHEETSQPQISDGNVLAQHAK
jgi:hypothetical protein